MTDRATDRVADRAESRADLKKRLVEAAADLLVAEGRDAVTTRAVSTAAGVQPPTIYRLFGDMNGLLAATAADGFARYLAQKSSRAPSADPVDDLRAGWDMHLDFGLGNPAHYLLMYGHPQPGGESDAAKEAHRLLREILERVARAGRLTVPVERAAQMVHGAGTGVTFALLALKPEERDLGVSAQTREAVIAAITTSADTDGDVPRAPDSAREARRRVVALRSILDDMPATYTPGERMLLEELLDRAGRDPAEG
ncbi:TetR/AcrR family transcriptional regulator [Streptomyces sp. DT2A-34]|uniref:TetR/AcrR family transcriptional regulator n=1 Tax=Streptomyces sp. DT2A-34 TaxID=3051182 RepID=UPI0034645DA6